MGNVEVWKLSALKIDRAMFVGWTRQHVGISRFWSDLAQSLRLYRKVTSRLIIAIHNVADRRMASRWSKKSSVLLRWSGTERDDIIGLKLSIAVERGLVESIGGSFRTITLWNSCE